VFICEVWLGWELLAPPARGRQFAPVPCFPGPDSFKARVFKGEQMSDHPEPDHDATPNDDPFAEAPASPDPIVEWQPNRRRLGDRLTGAVGSARRGRAMAIGAFALGAFAVGAVAIGTLAIGRLAVGRARVRTLRIDRLIIGRIEQG
jgi:hypothetical protein